MIFLTYFFIGIFTSIIGALPLGTVNVAVINTTIKENVNNALKIVYTAALAEVILAGIAMQFNMMIQDFIQMNTWVQYTIISVLVLVGIVLIFFRKECIKDENGECVLIKKRRIPISKQLLGFILGLINPTVLIYWLLVISFLSKKMIYLSSQTQAVLLALFFVGVFLGKAATLYGYGRFSFMLKTRMKNITHTINRIIGVLLLLVASVQLIKLFY